MAKLIEKAERAGNLKRKMGHFLGDYVSENPLKNQDKGGNLVKLIKQRGHYGLRCL